MRWMCVKPRVVIMPSLLGPLPPNAHDQQPGRASRAPVCCNVKLYRPSLTHVVLEPLCSRRGLVGDVIVAGRDQRSRLIDPHSHDRSNPARGVKHSALGEEFLDNSSDAARPVRISRNSDPVQRSRRLVFHVVRVVGAHSAVGLHRSVYRIIPGFDNVRVEKDCEPEEPHGHLGWGRLPRSLAERYDAHQRPGRGRRGVYSGRGHIRLSARTVPRRERSGGSLYRQYI